MNKINKSIKLILLTGIIPENQIEEVIVSSKVPIQFAADKLQRNLIKGLLNYFNDLSILNFPFLGGYPFSFRNSYISSSLNSIEGHSFFSESFLNINFIKHFFIEYKLKNKLKNIESNLFDNVIIVIYSTYHPFINSAIYLKKKNPSAKIVLLVPDLPDFINIPKNFFKKLYWNYSKKVFENSVKKIDGFIFISKYMAEMEMFKDKESEIIEGIIDIDLQNENFLEDIVKQDYIFYSGSLAERYGIKILVEAFINLNQQNVNLVICGSGDSESYLRNKQIQFENIIFLGNLNNKKVLSLQNKAKLLINPRQPKGEYTKFSFPSKVLEYFSSGRPTLMYKLEGIPLEYYKYCFCVENLDINSLTNKMKEIIDLDEIELTRIGHEAKEFVRKYKNPIIQTQKIVKLIRKISYE